MLLILLWLLTACSEVNEPSERWTFIAGRDGSLVYRALIPQNWEVTHPEGSQDTTKPLLSITIPRTDIEITVHNFPSDHIQNRIPPIAQVQRWIRQIQSSDPESIRINPVSQGGFTGLALEAEGFYKGKRVFMTAWSFQMDLELYQSIDLPSPKRSHHRQMQADYTIKAVGSVDEMLVALPAIRSFVKSFELIEEIPRR